MGVTARGRVAEPPALIVLLATLSAVVAACGNGPPSPDECIARWNHPGNGGSHAAVVEIGLSRAYVAGWPTKAGDHCSATFFTRPGEPWVMFVLWLDSPEPRTRFARDIGGSQYGRGQLGAEEAIPANAEVEEDGRLSER